MVLQVGTEMLGEGVNPLGEKRHLDLCGTGVSRVGLVLIVLLMGLAFSNDLRRLFGA